MRCGLRKKGQRNFMGGGGGVKIGGGIVRRDYTRRLASSSIFHAGEGEEGIVNGLHRWLLNEICCCS